MMDRFHRIERVGQQLGNYRLLRSLGEGGFAEVYLGEHIYLQRQDAIKIVKAQMTQTEYEAFVREAQTIARLDHPHIVRVLDFGIQQNTPYLVMSYAPNGSLRARLPAQSLPFATLVPYVQHIAAALQYAHDNQIIHRDVKPDNMLIGQHDEILLGDFGIATASLATSVQRTLDATGTPAYMAPEQFQGKPRPASDQYALAITLYEWLCGRRPFDGDFTALGYQHVHTLPQPLRTLVPSIPSAIEQVVLKALAKNPHERFESVSAFAAAFIEAAQSGQVESMAREVPVSKAPSPKLLLASEGHVRSAAAPTQSANNGHVSSAEARKHRAEHEPPASCFICAYKQTLTDHKAHRPCVETHIWGRLVRIQERAINGQTMPCLTIDRGSLYATVALEPDYYREFVRELLARGKMKHPLNVHFYHLPDTPTPGDYKGKTVEQYIGDTFTLCVLEPDTLLNITDISQADYCKRKYVLSDLVSSPPSSATILGNIVHQCFTGLLKDHEQKQNTPSTTSLERLRKLRETAIELNTLDMALAGVSPETIRTDSEPHLAALATWYEQNRSSLWGNNIQAVSVETLRLVPEIGLRGRLDIYWQQSTAQSLLELKTGGANGDVPKNDHRKQVQGYQTLSLVRRDEKFARAQARLLYSGTPGQATATSIPFNIRDIQRINGTRNILVLSHITGTPPPPPGVSRCTKCSVREQCERVSALLDWQPPTFDPEVQPLASNGSPATALRKQRTVTNEDRTFFAKYYHLLLVEGRASEQELARLWQLSVQNRVEQGKAINNLHAIHMPDAKNDGWTEDNDGWTKRFECDNRSELRKHDEILLSAGNPITGNVVTGTIMEIGSKSVTVWTREIIKQPTLIDKYDNDLVHKRTMQNLLRWLDVEPHLRDLVAGRVRPRFIDSDFSRRQDFNEQQNKAVERATQMQDYLLIQGPPGTGKTSVIAEIVKCLAEQGQRMLLAAFTNQAVDNMLKRLDKEGFHDYIRIGHERSVDEAIEPHLLKKLFENHLMDDHLTDDRKGHPSHNNSADEHPSTVYDLLRRSPVVASTTATWSSDKYTSSSPEQANEPSLFFDVAIIDEASQLTVPALLGALRFAKRFILVGDDKQLPPLVLSKEAAEQGLAESLFGFLAQREEDYMKDHREIVSALVKLETQYRMNKWIGHFSSTVFYNGKLQAAPRVANERLTFSDERASNGKRQQLAVQVQSTLLQAIEPDFPLVFLDVRGEPDHGIAKVSEAEAEAVCKIIAELVARGIKKGDIGVIAPFRAQVAMIRRKLLKAGILDEQHATTTEPKVTVDTVDRFQGAERSVIIMSFATTTEPQGERRDFLTNPNRLNVALTRAQHKLILVGCVAALEKLPVFSRLLAYCRSMKTLMIYEDTIL